MENIIKNEQLQFNRIGTCKTLNVNEKNGIIYLTFPGLESTGMVKHGFSTRIGGISEGIYSSLNFSYIRGDVKEAVDENYRRMTDVLEVHVEDLVFSHQTHTTNIRVVAEADRGKGMVSKRDYEDVDGLITNVPGLVLTTFFADCVPVFLVDSTEKAIGMIHSGWRGTVGKIAGKAVMAMKEEYGCKLENIRAAIGPSICVDCYEVSKDVAKAFQESFSKSQLKNLLFPKENEKYQLDLWKANRYILQEAGIPLEQIEVTDICTCCNPDTLFSHRASKGRRGNLAAFLSIR